MKIKENGKKEKGEWRDREGTRNKEQRTRKKEKGKRKKGGSCPEIGLHF